MDFDDLPAVVRRFLARHIDCVEQLEILVFLRRASSRFFSADSIARSLNLSEARVAVCLEALARHGLLDVRLAADVVYRFSPVPAMAPEVDTTAEAYSEHRSSVVAFVASRRRQALKDFSDAFRLKKDPEDG
jgi:biotin operon repressor